MFVDFKKDIENALIFLSRIRIKYSKNRIIYIFIPLNRERSINLESGICLCPLTFLKPYSKWIRKNKIWIYIFIENSEILEEPLEYPKCSFRACKSLLYSIL